MDVSDVKLSSEGSSSATIHGVVVGEMSPVKTSRKNSSMKYFDERFGDGKTTVRFVSFDPTLRNKLDDLRKSDSGVVLQNCLIKRKAPEDFELQLNNRSTVLSSPKKFKVSEDSVSAVPHCAEVHALEEIKDISELQLVTFIGKVTWLSQSEELMKKGGEKKLKKRDFLIADSTSSCRGVVWEQHIDMLEEGKCYKIMSATVRSFNGTKYVSLGERALINCVSDIGAVVEECVDEGAGGLVVVNAEIVAVLKNEVYIGCRICNSKLLEVGGVGECPKCGAKMKLAKCKGKKIARILLQDVNNKEFEVTMFDEIVEQVVGFSDTTSIEVSIDDKLLATPSLMFTIRNEVVTSVSKVLIDQ